ncbi:hypothetical protein ABL78_1590 [Leptomonas seymouri]|uniref:Uncharacterized protein n=1 Tax=Leptomonas seymouri TaxID=5684 RepID=A0A0N0P895_LEPSE|nr:hypothetical protein ABL78_1590 [Leptomonas seymouri]|eukprot:KPI89257.1 hypothetical protein ABL78_1590 [Leptomonas seymouri]
MSNEAYTSISNRVMSLEDIIRQQEQTIGAVLHRLRDVEQYAASEARNREQAQQQLFQVLGERGGSSAEAAQRMQGILQSQNERLGALQADMQGQAAALRGLDEKYDVALRGLEQRMQSDIGGVHQRAQASEAASMEAVRNIQAQLQGVSNATQAVDTRSRDDLLAVQQQLSGELAAQRLRTDNLENAIRDALRDMHGSLTAEFRSADTQHRAELDGAIQRVNRSLEALDERTRADMNQLHTVEQGDMNELGRRIEDLERNLREMLQASANGLATEVAQVAQHSQNLDRRQAAAHQTLLQELAKHDGQLESVDLNWRASVTELNAVVRESVAAAQQQAAAGDQALQRQLKSLEDRFTAAAETLTRSLSDVGHSIQENCVKPLNETQRALSAQSQRLSRVADEYATMQDSLKTFTSRVDQDASQFKQVVEAAMRALYADLLDRINITSASITMQPNPEAFRAELRRAMKTQWEDAKSVFLSQRSLNDIQAQLAALESAVRVELCALAERNSATQRSVDVIRVAQERAGWAVAHTRDTEKAGASHEAASGLPSPTGARATSTMAQALTPVEAVTSRSPVSSTAPPLPQANPIRFSSSLPTNRVQGSASRDSQGDDLLPLPLPPIQAFTLEQLQQSPSQPLPMVKEIDKDTNEEKQRDRDDVLRQQREKDISDLRASLNRLRLAQAQETDKESTVMQVRMEDGASGRDAVDAAAARVNGALREAQQAASRAGWALHDAKSAASEAGTSVQEAKSAAAQANNSSREARSAAAEAAESVKVSEAVQNETLRMANKLQLALERVGKIEETLQQRLMELNTKRRGSDARSTAGSADEVRLDSRVSAATGTAQRVSSLSGGISSAEGTAKRKAAEREESRLHGEEVEPPHERPVSTTTTTTALTSSLPKQGSRPPSALLQGAASKSPSSSENLIEVPGISKGEVFIVRQGKTDRTTPASVRQKPSQRDPPLLTPTPLNGSTAAAPTKPATPSDSDSSLPLLLRGSGQSEVLLPTNQFVRKREYNKFKDFTKQEIDAIWVELLNGRRNQGMPKEEVQLCISQNREQLLNTILQIVQRQEDETLGLLSNIKAQLMDVRNDMATTREVKVFPMDNGKHLEEVMRAISGNPSKASTDLVTHAPDPTSTSSMDAEASIKEESPPSTQQPVASCTPERPTTLLPISHDSGLVTPPSARMRPSSKRDTDTGTSSEQSTTPLIPQIISQVVHRHSSQPNKEKIAEVVIAGSGSFYPPQSVSNPQCSQSASAPHLEATLRGSLHSNLYAVEAPVDPSMVAPASRPAEPESAVSKYYPTGVALPLVGISPTEESGPSSANLSTARRLSLEPLKAPDLTPRYYIVPSYSSADVPPRGAVPRMYQEQEEDLIAAQMRYLREGRSLRNPVGSTTHLSPLRGVGSNNSNVHLSPLRLEAGELGGSLATREQPQGPSRKILKGGAKLYDSLPPRYPFPLHSTPVMALDSNRDTGSAPALPDAFTDRFEPLSPQDSSSLHYASVADQRPPRQRVQPRSSKSASSTLTHRANDPKKSHGQSNNRLASAPSCHSGRREGEKTRQETQQSGRADTPVRGPSTDAVRTSVTPSNESPSVRVLPSKDLIHIGPYNPPRDESGGHLWQQQGREEDGKRVVVANTNRMGNPTSPSSLQRHADHNPHVYAPHGERDLGGRHNSSQLLDASPLPLPSPEHGSRDSTSASGYRSSAAPVTPVRVLDAPVTVSGGSAKNPNSTAAAGNHIYRGSKAL